MTCVVSSGNRGASGRGGVEVDEDVDEELAVEALRTGWEGDIGTSRAADERGDVMETFTDRLYAYQKRSHGGGTLLSREAVLPHSQQSCAAESVRNAVKLGLGDRVRGVTFGAGVMTGMGIREPSMTRCAFQTDSEMMTTNAEDRATGLFESYFKEVS